MALSRPQLRKLVVTGFITVGILFLLSRSFETPQSKESRARDEVAFWTQVLKNYCEDKGQCPGSQEGLAVLTREGYVRYLPMDPWGRPFGYASPGPGGAAFEIWSTGADGSAHIGLR
jgi:general secretion pathway protein G